MTPNTSLLLLLLLILLFTKEERGEGTQFEKCDVVIAGAQLLLLLLQYLFSLYFKNYFSFAYLLL